jgi:aldose 1-epimerase
MPAHLEIGFGDWRAQVSPEIGGALLGLQLRGRPVLRPTPEEACRRREVRRTACFPLLPYANRIASGRLRVGGRDYRLRENFPDSPHPLHGVGWRRPWQVASAGASACELRLAHRPSGEAALDWPFAFDAVETFRLGAAGLTVDLAITNLADVAAPLGLGLHPLFARRGTQTLTFSAAGAWRNGADGLPLAIETDASWDHGRGRHVGAEPLDNDFFGWRGPARIAEQDGFEVRIAATAVFSVLRIFTPPDKDFFGVEPVSHVADAINRPELSAGALRPSAPGARVEGSVTIDAGPAS